MSSAEPTNAQERTPEPERPGGLSPKQEVALRVLLGGGSVTEAAQEAGVRREQVSRWKHRDEAFREALREAQGDLRKAVRLRLEAAAGEAVGVLHDLLADANARNRLLAAKAILGFVSDLTAGAGDGAGRPGELPAWDDTIRFSGEAERRRLEEFARFPPAERETMRLLLERLRQHARDLARAQEAEGVAAAEPAAT